MKKNGRKYRERQKEKERRQLKNTELRKTIIQEVDEINTAFLSMAHIVIYNPIISDSIETKREYLRRLNSYIRAGGWNRRKYENSQLCAYESIILQSEDGQEIHMIDFYQYYILFDVMHILGYDMKNITPQKLESVKKRYYKDFSDMVINPQIVNQIFMVLQGESKKLKQLENTPVLVQEKEYIGLILKNIAFQKRNPFGVMVTATMSAGKSTFINALTGKYICLSQNMACTSKIHCIVNKAYEDGYSYEYDYDLVLTAGRDELLNDNEHNSSDKIVVSTHFKGNLENQRMIVNDSPGVNFSGDMEHKAIAEKLIKRKNYNLLIYIMNATQLSTNDEDGHLDFVKQIIGRTPVIFIINKIDSFNVDEESIGESIKRQTEYLRKKGFKYPIVCPVSSKAGYLAKRFSAGELSRIEKRELYNYIDKFEKMGLTEYYAKIFPGIKIADSSIEEEQLLKTSGFAYIEKIILYFTTGGKANGTGLRYV